MSPHQARPMRISSYFARCFRITAGILLLELLAACGPKLSEHAAEPKKTVQLPEYFGVYLLDKDKVTRLQDDAQSGERLNVSPNAKFIVYDTKASQPNADRFMELGQMKFIGKKVQEQPDGTFQVELVQKLVLWAGIELLIKPLEKPNMFMLVPPIPLESATYRLSAFGETFSFSVGGSELHFDLWNNQPLLADDFDKRVAAEIASIINNGDAGASAERLILLLKIAGEGISKLLHMEVANAWCQYLIKASEQNDFSFKVQDICWKLFDVDAETARNLQQKLVKIRRCPALEKIRSLKSFDGTLLTNTIGMKFVPVPGTNVAFSIWQTRVQDFKVFVTETGYDATSVKDRDGNIMPGVSWKSPGFKQEPDHPVVCVNWFDAQKFCEWLTKKDQAAGILGTGQFYRLPTDEEWSTAVGLPKEIGTSPEEKKSKSEFKDLFPWGKQWPPPKGAGNFAGEEILDHEKYGKIDGYNDGYPYTAPVGSFRPNLFGIFDMGGNVHEWCQDNWSSSDTARVVRGSSWYNILEEVFCLPNRFKREPDVRDGNGDGFRCVVVLGTSQ